MLCGICLYISIDFKIKKPFFRGQVASGGFCFCSSKVTLVKIKKPSFCDQVASRGFSFLNNYTFGIHILSKICFGRNFSKSGLKTYGFVQDIPKQVNRHCTKHKAQRICAPVGDLDYALPKVQSLEGVGCNSSVHPPPPNSRSASGLVNKVIVDMMTMRTACSRTEMCVIKYIHIINIFQYILRYF